MLSLSTFLEARFPHRTLTHSFLATGAIGFLVLPLLLLGEWRWWFAVWGGHLLSVFSDTFTKQGVQLFYPVPVWCVCGANPNRRMRTGGPGEYWVLSGAVALLCVNLWLTSNGGLLMQASQTLGLKEGAVRTYNEKAATHQLYAIVEGVWVSDRTSASGRYAIVVAEGSEFVVRTPKGLAKTGTQIVTTKVAVDVGEAATVRTQTISLNDEGVERLEALAREFPGALVSGELVVDAPEELRLAAVGVDQLATIELVGGTVKLKYRAIGLLVADLREQYVTGSLSLQVMP
ncbi:MAG: metal-dependent hydrolase [Synechococcales cyanobacterium CRU_2_2]|nr:metal-dependent hydrolase [Synechococcales cyanobacterium CRU_2_2]